MKYINRFEERIGCNKFEDTSCLRFRLRLGYNQPRYGGMGEATNLDFFTNFPNKYAHSTAFRQSDPFWPLIPSVAHSHSQFGARFVEGNGIDGIVILGILPQTLLGGMIPDGDETVRTRGSEGMVPAIEFVSIR